MAINRNAASVITESIKTVLIVNLYIIEGSLVISIIDR